MYQPGEKHHHQTSYDTGDRHERNQRGLERPGASGIVLRTINTPAQTSVKANKVPILHLARYARRNESSQCTDQ